MKKIVLGITTLFISSFSYAPLGAGLVSQYYFNGNANDMSGNNHGIVSGATLAMDRFGSPNSAYCFNGQNNLINLGTSASLRSGTNDQNGYCFGLHRNRTLSYRTFRLNTYPNPSSGKINFNRAQPLNSKVRIYDQLGHKLGTWQINQLTQSELDCSFLSKGIYFVLVDCEDSSIIKRLIID